MTKTCRCGRGKMSAYDGKCGHCRTNRERKIHRRLIDGWSPVEAALGYRMKPGRYAAEIAQLPDLPPAK